MNLKMQIAHIERNLRRYNPGVDPSLLLRSHSDEIVWKDDLDSTLTLEENIDELEQLYPELNWRAPKKHARPDKPIRWKEEDFQAGQYGNYYEMHAGVIVKRHNTKAKGKTYTCGRIQLTVDERYIGRTAEVHIIIRH